MDQPSTLKLCKVSGLGIEKRVNESGSLRKQGSPLVVYIKRINEEMTSRDTGGARGPNKVCGATLRLTAEKVVNTPRANGDKGWNCGWYLSQGRPGTLEEDSLAG